MNGNTALDLVMARLVRPTDTTLRASALVEMNNLIHTALENGPLVPWFLLANDTTTMTTAAGVETVDLPAGFIRFDDDMEIGGLWKLDAAVTGPDAWVPLARSGYNKLKDYYAEEDATDEPVVYDLVVDKVYLRPIPDAVYQLRVMAYFADVDVEDAGAETKWLKYAADLVIASVAELLARVYLRNYDLATAMREDVKRAGQRVAVANTAFIESMKSRAMGDD